MYTPGMAAGTSAPQVRSEHPPQAASSGQDLYQQVQRSTQPEERVNVALEHTPPDQKARLADAFIDAAGREGVIELSATPEGQHTLAQIYDHAGNDGRALIRQVHNDQGNTAVDYSQRESNNDPTPGMVAGAVTGGPARFTRSDAITRANLADFANEVRNGLQTGALGRNQVGPVGTVIVDNITGQNYRSLNSRTLPENLHPLLSARMDNLDPTRMHGSRPGTHAEIHALNDALWVREEYNTARGINRPIGEADLSTFTMDTFWTRTQPQNARMTEGTAAPRCANCTQLTDGVRNLAGDSPASYDVLQAERRGVSDPAGSPPRGPYTSQDFISARNAALVGGGVGFGLSTIKALSDGHITSDEALGIATDTGVAAVTGAAGDYIENRVARAITQPVSRSVSGAATRSIAGRLTGAGAAGAVIGAGFSAVDQIGAYRRGEVSGSEAIGNVAGEAVVGAGAGMAGAAAGAAIGSIIPGAGTLVGGVIGFGVGMAAGYLADRGLHAAGLNELVASGVTSAIDAGAELISSAGNSISNASRSLVSVFGW